MLGAHSFVMMGMLLTTRRGKPWMLTGHSKKQDPEAPGSAEKRGQTD